MAFRDIWKNKTDDQDYVNAEDINIIAQEIISMEEENEKVDHSKLKHLSFEESGHTGFQKELTEEELKSFEVVKNKEDKSNKIRSINEIMDDGNTQYLSAGGTLSLVISETDNVRANVEAYADAKFGQLDERVSVNEDLISQNINRIIAVEDKSAELEIKGEFELVVSGTLEEKVGIIEHTFSNRYKELYVRMIIPKSEEAAAGNASTEKARWVIQTLNDSGYTVNKPIYNMGNQFIQDFTEEWATVIHIKVFNNYCRTELWYDRSWYLRDGYARGMNSSTYSGYVAPSVTMVRDYIDRLKLIFMTANQVTDGSVRYLPANTTYEIWGIRK